MSNFAIMEQYRNDKVKITVINGKDVKFNYLIQCIDKSIKNSIKILIIHIKGNNCENKFDAINLSLMVNLE